MRLSDKFKERERVRMTKVAVERGFAAAGTMPILPSNTGIVISCQKDSVYILRDGRKTIEKYAATYWEREEELLLGGLGI